MMLNTAMLKQWAGAIGLLCAAALLTGCSLMDLDRDHCPEGLNVSFAYDYNTQRADMFCDHVGGIEVFVFDENGKLVASRCVSNDDSNQPLKTPGYTMEFDDLPAGNYQVLAAAFQHDRRELLGKPGAKFRLTTPAVGETMAQLYATLDHEAPEADGTCPVKQDGLPLDTLWLTLPEPAVAVDHINPTFTTARLVRHTKDIHLTLRQGAAPYEINHEDYEVSIVDANGRIAADNSLTDPTPLRYTPYAAWNTSLAAQAPENREAVATGTTAHYNLNTSRLIYPETGQQGALLRVVRKSTGALVFETSLPRFLAEGRNAYESLRWTPQEYLDREYDYDLHLFLVGDRWEYVEMSIGILGWSRRVMNVDL